MTIPFNMATGLTRKPGSVIDVPVVAFSDFNEADAVLGTADVGWDETSAGAGATSTLDTDTPNGVFNLDGGTGVAGTGAEHATLHSRIDSYLWSSANTRLEFQCRVRMTTTAEAEFFGFGVVAGIAGIGLTPAADTCFGFWHLSDGNIQYAVNNDGSTLQSGTTGKTFATVGAGSAGTWYTLGGTWDGTKCRFYVDGELVKTVTPTASPSDNLAFIIETNSVTGTGNVVGIDYIYTATPRTDT